MGGAVFVFRYFTFREFRTASKVYDRGIERTLDGLCDDLIAAIRGNLVGWRGVTARDGQEIPYDPDRLEDVLSHGEAWDLLGEARREGRITSAEKNASGSSSPGDGEPSAADRAEGASTGPA